MSRKVCLLQAREIKALRKKNRKPNCVCHGHISREEADEMMRVGDLQYVGLGKTYARITATSKRAWEKVTQKVMGEPIGYTTMQLVR
jgi:2-keto-3-deoxy-6-phosphogluconate aldolase